MSTTNRDSSLGTGGKGANRYGDECRCAERVMDHLHCQTARQMRGVELPPPVRIVRRGFLLLHPQADLHQVHKDAMHRAGRQMDGGLDGNVRWA